ncbi:MAG: HPr family phosphocarrier protein [Candidatus Omnitrophica bacterium]|nr:HPr family phosphocarrier protein [Candidatus Omnitrophota bacterium]MDD5770863.1 HPr family phosphocarrier protein [Candidatus Omnitrophota bacterium]
MPLIKKELTVKNGQGLHARPAALFVQIANKFDSRITVRHDDEEVNGKSIMGILMLGAEKGSLIIVEADGVDAEEAMKELEKLINSEEAI